MNYYEALSKIHKLKNPSLYLEIGVRNGESLQNSLSNVKCIAIDPAYNMTFPYNHNTIFNKVTSDEYFNGDLYEKQSENKKIDLAFIDGMHLFENVLRDFINVEKRSSNSGTILLHDCLPPDEISASRERQTSVWTGDVWKLVPILKAYRKDLKITVIDASPTGLVIIERLNCLSDVLEKKYDEILKKFIQYDFAEAKNIKKISSEKHFKIPIIKKTILKSKTFITKIIAKKISPPKCLGILMCYNDADIVQDAINSMVENNHDILVWNHSSDDETDDIIQANIDKIIEYKIVPRDFDFYKMYPALSKHIINNFADKYDWISWPDLDEILEGPTRNRSYYDYITKIYKSKYDWIEFNNFNYWFVEKDDELVKSPIERIKHYCLFPNCSPRVRSWRASKTNIRNFNHNPINGNKLPYKFNLRHYPMRSQEQMLKRLNKDRFDIQRGDQNYHYNVMKKSLKVLSIQSKNLHMDKGEDLDYSVVFDWDKIYKGSNNR
jgi:hypothetical protein